MKRSLLLAASLCLAFVTYAPRAHAAAFASTQTGAWNDPATLNLGATYNARVTLKVIGGEGRVTAYASVIDSVTQDPTCVPAQ